MRTKAWLSAAALVELAFLGCGDAANDPPDADGSGGELSTGGDGSGGKGSTGGNDSGGKGSTGGNDAGGKGSTGGNDSGGLGGEGGQPTPTPLGLGEYCARRASRYFDYLADCYGGTAYSESDRDEYVDNVERRCRHAERAVDEGRLSYDADAAARCLAEVEAGYCVVGANPPTCAGVFAGLIEPGGECWGEESLVFLVGVSSCRDGRCVEDGECPGVCEELPATGEPCTEICRAGDVCAEDGRCRTLPGAGEPCFAGGCAENAACLDDECVRFAASDDDACGADVTCAPPTVCHEGFCRSAVEVGEPCLLASQCPSPATCRDGTCQPPGGEGSSCEGDQDCASGLYCLRGATLTCTPFVASGEPCSGQDRCEPGYTCVSDPDVVEARCREKVSEGESCEDSFALCDEGTYCSADLVCEPPGAQGESCWSIRPCQAGLGCHCTAENTDDCVTSQQLDGDTCEPLVADGEPCFTYLECESLDCDVSASTAPDEPGVCITRVQEECLP